MKKNALLCFDYAFAKSIIFLGNLMLGACLAQAQTPVPLQIHQLANGMKIILVEKHSAPVFAACLTFQTGSVNDPLGASGVAHFCEHMLFKGTRSFGLKPGVSAQQEDALLQQADDLWEAILAEKAALAQAAKQQFYSTGKAGAETSPTLIQRQSDLKAVEVSHRGMVKTNAIGHLFEKAGGVGINGGTGADYTAYYISLPKNRFEFYCRMEADRFANPVFREFHTEREVIKEERRMGVEEGEGGRGPLGILMEPLLAAAFPYHPYGRHTIGEMSDLDGLRREEVRRFFTQYYAPNRCALVLVGDLTMKECLPALESYFGKMPRQPDPRPLTTLSPKQRGEKRITVEKAVTPLLYVGWHVPAMGHPDVPALEVLSDLLSKGRTSRLYQKAVEEKALTNAFSTHYGDPGAKWPTLFAAHATVKAPHTTEELEQVLYEALARLEKEGPTQAELDKVKRNAEMDMLKEWENWSEANKLAYSLGVYWALTNDPHGFLRALERVKDVTAADIQRVIRTYFTRQNRIVGTLVRPEAMPASAKGSVQ